MRNNCGINIPVQSRTIMIKKTEFFIGFRYLNSKKSNGFISFVSMMSLTGIVLGVATLITILSVMNGFENELRDRLLSMSAHGYIEGPMNKNEWENQYRLISESEEVNAISPTIVFNGIIKDGSSIRSVNVNGIIPEYESKILGNNIQFIAGDIASLTEDSNSVLIGKNLAFSLNLFIDDDILLMIPIVDNGVIEPILSKFKVRGFFEAGIQEHDNSLVLMNFYDASKLLPADDNFRLRYIIDDPMLSQESSKKLTELLGKKYSITDWTQENSAYFGAIKLEKVMMSIILMLVIAVAAFNIIASLIMTVTEKRGDIAVLRTLGISSRSIKNIFLYQGSLISFLGVTAGVILGCVVALNTPEWAPMLENFFGFQIMPSDVFYVTRIPSIVKIGDIALISFFSFLITSVASYYPARRATQIEPASILRGE